MFLFVFFCEVNICKNMLIGLKHSRCRKGCDDDNEDHIALLDRIFRAA